MDNMDDLPPGYLANAAVPGFFYWQYFDDWRLIQLLSVSHREDIRRADGRRALFRDGAFVPMGTRVAIGYNELLLRAEGPDGSLIPKPMVTPHFLDGSGRPKSAKQADGGPVVRVKPSVSATAEEIKNEDIDGHYARIMRQECTVAEAAELYARKLGYT